MEPTLVEAWWMTLLTAMTPVFELRGAIPVGVAAGLSLPVTIVTAIIGNFIPVPFILLLVRKIFNYLIRFPKLKKIVVKLRSRANQKGDIVRKYQAIGLAVLVAVPLPGTGAWTGAMVADVLDIRMRTALPAIFAGIVGAAIIVTMVTYGVTIII